MVAPASSTGSDGKETEEKKETATPPAVAVAGKDEEGLGHCLLVGGHSYVGHFSNGMMHGKGEYRWKDGTTYEGDFYWNTIHGTGHFTWPDGSSYEGEVAR